MPRARFAERVRSFHALSPPASLLKPTGKLSDISPFGFLWRLHYIDMTDEITDCWQCSRTQTPAPLPLPLSSPERRD